MFHSPEYIEFLQAIGNDWDDEKMEKKMEEFGLGICLILCYDMQTYSSKDLVKIEYIVNSLDTIASQC